MTTMINNDDIFCLESEYILVPELGMCVSGPFDTFKGFMQYYDKDFGEYKSFESVLRGKKIYRIEKLELTDVTPTRGPTSS